MVGVKKKKKKPPGVFAHHLMGGRGETIEVHTAGPGGAGQGTNSYTHYLADAFIQIVVLDHECMHF